MKRTFVITCLILSSTQSISSNACLIDGVTVFQKAPCPIQESRNLTKDIRDYRIRKARKKEEAAAHKKQMDQAYKEKLRVAEAEYKNSPEGKAERRARLDQHRAIDNGATLRRIEHAIRWGQ